MDWTFSRQERLERNRGEDMQPRFKRGTEPGSLQEELAQCGTRLRTMSYSITPFPESLLVLRGELEIH